MNVSLQDIFQQVELCRHDSAEKSQPPETELLLLLQMCRQLPENILRLCPQIQSINEISLEVALDNNVKRNLADWIYDDLCALGYNTSQAVTQGNQDKKTG